MGAEKCGDKYFSRLFCIYDCCPSFIDASSCLTLNDHLCRIHRDCSILGLVVRSTSSSYMPAAMVRRYVGGFSVKVYDCNGPFLPGASRVIHLLTIQP